MSNLIFHDFPKKNRPSSKIARLSNGYASEVSTDAEHDEPLWLLDADIVRLWVTQALPVDLACLVDLLLRTMADEHGLSAPLDDRILALGDARELNLNLRERKHVCRRRQGAQKLRHGRLGDRRGEYAHGTDHEIRESAVGRGGGCLVSAQVGDFGGISTGRGDMHGALLEEGARSWDWGGTALEHTRTHTHTQICG